MWSKIIYKKGDLHWLSKGESSLSQRESDMLYSNHKWQWCRDSTIILIHIRGNSNLALNSEIKTYQILKNDDEVSIPSLSNIFLAVQAGEKIKIE